MGMTTTLPATISLAAIGDTESGTGVIIGNSGTTTINYDDTVISVEMRFGQSSAPCPNGYTLIEFGANLSADDITVTAVGNGSTTLEFVSGKPAVTPTVSIPVTVGAVAEDESYLNKRGLAHFWENIDDIKQNKLTAGTGILITNDVISATGGGTADAVDWGHITGSMSNQTDLTTALAAKANSADLAAVATSGDYDDLTDKPTIGNATLTIQKNGTSAGTFTANATSNKTINITVPTTAADVSALPASTKYGASIAVSINTTDYKVTTTLKDQDGNTLGTAQVIDLPLESVVVNGSYDSTNKKIVLTLQNGNTIDIPVGDLVAGLQSEITAQNMLSSDLVDDTNHTHKFMTSAEKTKLSGIAAGAEVNVQSDWNQTTTTADDYIKNKPTLATVATSGSYNDLSNKPTIPTVNNATLTIQKNGTNVQTFTANQGTNATANIVVPTKTSDLTNDSGYITSYTDTQVTQTRVDPSEITTFYPVASTSSTTNTGDVKKFSAVRLNYASDDGGRAELELGQNSYYDPVYGELTLWDGGGGSSQHKTTLRRATDTTNQTFYFPYNADSTSGTLVANGAANAGTGSATNPVYADSDGILHATTYALNKTVPSNAVFTDTTYSDATTSTAGLMSAADKSKLNSIAAGAEVNVQANWAQTTETADDYIRNKPTIPTVNNATLTIQKNGTTVNTFTANASSNVTANITVPTIDDVVEIDKTLAAVTDWTNTGIYGPNLETGTYVVQVFTGGSYANTWSERWSGIMSWHSGNTNSGNTEEILLHNAGHADNSQNLFLRTKRDGVTVSGTKYLTLQYAFSQASENTTTIKFYFRRII